MSIPTVRQVRQNNPHVPEGTTCSADSYVHEYKVRIHSTSLISSDQLKDLIQKKYKCDVEMIDYEPVIMSSSPDVFDNTLMLELGHAKKDTLG